MGKMSKDKGKRYEREVANLLKSEGYDTRRGVQYCGREGNADVIGLPGIHIECKHVERLNLYDAIEQAKFDCKGGNLPTVFHRKNHHEQLVTMTFDGWIQMYREYESSMSLKEGDSPGTEMD